MDFVPPLRFRPDGGVRLEVYRFPMLQACSAMIRYPYPKHPPDSLSLSRGTVTLPTDSDRLTNRARQIKREILPWRRCALKFAIIHRRRASRRIATLFTHVGNKEEHEVRPSFSSIPIEKKIANPRRNSATPSFRPSPLFPNNFYSVQQP